MDDSQLQSADTSLRKVFFCVSLVFFWGGGVSFGGFTREMNS